MVIKDLLVENLQVAQAVNFEIHLCSSGRNSDCYSLAIDQHPVCPNRARRGL